MAHALTRAVSALVPALVLLVSPAAAQQSRTQFPPFRPPRAADGHPDLNGVWQAFVTADWDLQNHEAQPGPRPEINGVYGAGPAGQTIIEGDGMIPYQPWALEKKKQNFANRTKTDVSSDETWHQVGDPEFKCYMAGVPRANYMPFPFRIVQGSSPFLLFTYEYASAQRIVRMNTKQVSPGPAPIASWMGWSRGSWEGDTLVVDVTGQREETWLDRAGDFHSGDLHVVERYTLASPYHIQYEATIEDPKVYTRPWTISFPLYRRMEKNAQLLEFKCEPFTEELLYGRFSKESSKK